MPLAARMRPQTLDDIIGQPELTRPDSAFRKAAEAGKLGSIILWGPPGVGKTTLADILARLSGSNIAKVSAVQAGVPELRKIIDQARRALRERVRTVLFIDEIHRFNKAQQDAILPVVEDGTITLIGATTENPSFEVNSALLSRARVFVLHLLTDENIAEIIERALSDERGLRANFEPEAKALIVNLSNGDARAALGMLELAAATGEDPNTLEQVKEVIQRRQIAYDKGGEQHFDLISALHKCVRDSDPDASLYWLARMLEGGEDPMYIARRLIRMATEDIGLAQPQALPLTIAAQQAVHTMGMPEAALALAEAVVFLALAPKSNAVYRAYKEAVKDVQETRNDPVPLHLRNAPTKLMKNLGYGEGYQYAHDAEDAKVDQEHLPETLRGRVYYRPTPRGWEGKLKE
ncbi:MAG: replication-associated recombination protein A [Methanoregulaceae archaeon]|nr:replication-associated recombination protein A [Methanoregulaceae archaeon]